MSSKKTTSLRGGANSKTSTRTVIDPSKGTSTSSNGTSNVTSTTTRRTASKSIPTGTKIELSPSSQPVISDEISEEEIIDIKEPTLEEKIDVKEKSKSVTKKSEDKPVLTRTVRKRSVSKPKTSVSVDVFLKSIGYSLIENIITGTGDDEIYYIKAIDPIGNIVLIKLNEESNESTLPQVRLGEKSDNNLVSDDIKRSLYNIFAPSISGTAVICSEGTCFISRTSDEKMTNQTFLSKDLLPDTNESSARIGIIDGNNVLIRNGFIAMPIINLKDIESDNISVLKLTEKISGEIMSSTTDISGKQLTNFGSSVQSFTEVSTFVMGELVFLLEEMTSRSDEYHKRSASNYLSKKSNHSEILEKLQKNEKRLSNVIGLISITDELSQKINQITSELDNIAKYINQELSEEKLVDI